MTAQTCSFKINQPIRTVNLNGLEIGADKSFHFLLENENSSKPLYVLELNISHPEESSHIVEDVYRNLYNNPVEWVTEAQKSECDILGLKFNIADTENIEDASNLLKTLLPHITKPLMIRGVNNSDVDIKLIPALTAVLDRESIVAFADENTYKAIVPPVISGNHVLVIRTPIDINLAKEMNILTSDLGLNLDRILIDTDMGGLGYGLEYGYSIMERIKLAAFEGDTMLNMPIIAFAGEESLKTKETKSDTFDKSWGDFKKRSIMFEITAASAIAAAGANIIVLNHPKSIKTLKGLL
jgi:acetyl-CoA decarbonylase/synthase complex subunit delta